MRNRRPDQTTASTPCSLGLATACAWAAAVAACLAAPLPTPPVDGDRMLFRCAGASAVTSLPARATPKAGPLANQPARGRLTVLVVYAGFADEAATEPLAPAAAATLLDPTQEGSLAHFYRTMSSGQLELSGTVLPRRYGAAGTKRAYVNTTPGRRGDYGSFVREVFEQVDRDIDCRQFDNDGPDGVPDSGDDDGVIDYVFIIARSTPAGFLLGGATGIADLGLTQELVTADIGHGRVAIRLSGSTVHGCVVAQGAYGPTVGAMAHEFGHALGLPDLYDLSYTDRPSDSAGIGRWGLMGWGAHGWSGSGGPEPFCPWSLEQLGWLGHGNDRLVEVTERQTELVARDLLAGGPVYKVHLPATASSRVAGQGVADAEAGYLLLEWRTRRGRVYGGDLPAEGLLVWHVRPDQRNNDDEQAKLVDLVCADGVGPDGQDGLDRWAHDEAWNQAQGGNQGDAGDPFDGVRRTEFNERTDPACGSLGGFGTAAVTPLRLSVRRQGDQALLSVDPPRWAGRLDTEAYWAGTVMMDGDLTVAPAGWLHVAPHTQVRIAGRDRLAAGLDPARCELRVEGSLRVSATAGSAAMLRTAVPGAAWYGLTLVPSDHSAIVIPAGALVVQDAVHTGYFPEAPAGAEGLVLRTAAIVDSAKGTAAGNGDGQLQPGESVQVVLELANWGLTPQSAVRLTARWNGQLTTTWPGVNGAEQQVSQVYALGVGGRRQLALPPLTLATQARAGQTASIRVELRAQGTTTVQEVPLTVGAALPLPTVAFAVGDPTPGDDTVIVASAAEAVPVRLAAPRGGVTAVEVVAFDVTHQRVAATVPLVPTHGDGTLFTGSLLLPMSSYRVAARVHTTEGAVFLAADRARVEVPLDRWQAALVVRTPAQTSTLSTALTAAMAARGLGASYLTPTTLGQLGMPLLRHYCGRGRVVVLLAGNAYSDYTDAVSRFLTDGGRLLLAARPYSRFPGAPLRRQLGAEAVTLEHGALRWVDQSEPLPTVRTYGRLTGVAAAAQPVLVSADSGVVGLRLDSGQYRSVYCATDLPLGSATATFVERQIEWLLSEGTGPRLTVQAVLDLPAVTAPVRLRPRLALHNPGDQDVGAVTVTAEVTLQGQRLTQLVTRLNGVPAGARRTAWLPAWQPTEERDYQVRFTVATERGLAADAIVRPVRVVRTAGRFDTLAATPAGQGNGVAVADLDRDGQPEVLVVRQGAPNQLLRRTTAGWQDGAVAAGVAGHGQGRGVAVGDWDADGDLDLYLVNQPTGAADLAVDGANQLLANQGDGRFVEVTATADVGGRAGLADAGSGRSAGFLDYDGDGDLDLYLVNATATGAAGAASANRLFRNDAGAWTEVAQALGVADGANGRGLAIADYDQDGDPDLYVASRQGTLGSELWRNEVAQGRGFVAAGAASGLVASPMAVAAAWGDADGDGDLDLFVADESGDGHLWRSQNRGVDPTTGALTNVAFTPVGVDEGGPDVTRAVGVAWADYDDDGDLDLVTTGLDGAAAGDQIHHNRGAAGFVAVGPLLRLRSSSNGRGLAAADLDQDGRLDLVVADLRQTTAYLNRTPAAHWLEVALGSDGANRNGLGARMALYTGRQAQVRHLTPTGGYASQGPVSIHFGLGLVARADSLRIWWPDGTQSRRGGTAADRRLTLTQPVVRAATGRRASTAVSVWGLDGPYPNPTNGAVTLPFNLPGAETVEVAIYNATGQRIRRVWAGPLAAGRHVYSWGTDDDHGQPVASGVYLCRLTVGSRQQVRRLVVVR